MIPELKLLGKTILFLLLTLLTQIGGLVYLLSFTSYPSINQRLKGIFSRNIAKLGIFLALYTLATFVLVPLLAPQFGRVPLPILAEGNLKPLTFITPFLNRHYVRPELKEAAQEVADQMNEKFPGTSTQYLDANFPFLDRFPLFPHLSHNDGKKMDLAFFYEDKAGKETNESPSFIGYGICEDSLPGEVNTAEVCAQNGYWQYSFLTAVVPQSKKEDFSFDAKRTGALVNFLASSEEIGKVFIEPHLKQRLRLKSDKIRFHGCQAVRHDDHIHLQLK